MTTLVRAIHGDWMNTRSVHLECGAILFDSDGVLVDSTDCVRTVWSSWASRRGLDPDRVLAVIHGRRAVDTIRSLAPGLQAEDEAAELLQWEEVHTEGVRAMPGARALLHAIPAGAWAVITSGSRKLVTARLKAARLPVPDVLITAADVERGKPDPSGYLLAAKRLAIRPSDGIVLEDAPAGLRAAAAAGMRAIAVTSTHAAGDLVEAITHISAPDAITVSGIVGALTVTVQVRPV